VLCPLTQERFKHPVLAEDGHIYEKKAIEQWLNLHSSSPITREFIGKNLKEVYPLKDLRDSY